MIALDDPKLRSNVLDYVRKHGQVKGYDGMCEETIISYCHKHPEFKMLIEIAKQLYGNPQLSSLQAYWDANAQMFEVYAVQNLMQMLLEGEKHTTEEITYRPKYEGSANNRKRIYEEDGTPQMEVSKQVVKTENKGVPKWAHDTAIELMQKTFGQSDLSRLTPSIVWAFLQFLKKKIDIPQEVYTEMLGASQEFERVIKMQQAMLKDGKKK